MTLLPLHIIAGAIALAAGAVALYVFKGARLHRQSGMIFVYAMLVMSASGAVMAALKPNRGNVMGGVLTLYLVITGLLTVRRRVAGFDWKNVGAMLLGLTVGMMGLKFALDALHSPNGMIDGYPPPLYFIFGTVALLGAFGDIRVMAGQGIQGPRLLARHLWRMCFAMFIATGSFFLGQAKVFPKPIRIIPVLAIPVLLVLLLMLYWLARVLLMPGYSRHTPGEGQ